MHQARGQPQADSASPRSDGQTRRPPFRRFALLVALLLACTALPRALAVDRLVSPDEKRWLTHSANFYRALTQGEPAETYQILHPGVTVMWVGTAAFLWRYPGYPGEVTGQIDWTRHEVASYLLDQGRDPLDLLATAHLLMAVTISLVLAASAWWAARLFGLGAAILGLLLVAADPFHIALSRLLHLDGLTSAFVLLALVSLLCWLYRGGRRADLLVSGVAAGLAALTKSPALFLAPFTALVLLLESARRSEHRGPSRPDWRRALRPFTVWAAAAAGTFVLLWPAMWVDPVLTVGRILAGALGYAVEGHVEPLYFAGRVVDGDPGWSFYPATYLWRTTPAVLLGLGLAAAARLVRPEWLARDQRRPLAMLLLFAGLFTAFISLGSKKFDRYLLPIYPPLALAAGTGWAAAARWIRWRSSPAVARVAVPALAMGVVGSQAVHAADTFPYYLTYYNPLLGGTRAAPAVMMVGWGEGLDQVARYLDSRTDVPSPRVMVGVWGGTFSYLFKGRIRDTNFRPGPSTVEAWKDSDFCVIYINQWQRRQLPPELLAYLGRLDPVFTLRLEGLTYAYVYDIRGVAPPEYLHRPPG